jgi:hypothetical protein
MAIIEASGSRASEPANIAWQSAARGARPAAGRGAWGWRDALQQSRAATR